MHLIFLIILFQNNGRWNFWYMFLVSLRKQIFFQKNCLIFSDNFSIDISLIFSNCLFFRQYWQYSLIVTNSIKTSFIVYFLIINNVKINDAAIFPEDGNVSDFFCAGSSAGRHCVNFLFSSVKLWIDAKNLCTRWLSFYENNIHFLRKEFRIWLILLTGLGNI